MDVKIFWEDSRGKVIALLLFLWLSVLVSQFRAVFVTVVIFSVAATVVLDALFLWLRTKTFAVSLSSMVTGLLIGLIVDPYGGLLTATVACLFASTSKNFICKGQRNHIFNPAAFGIVTSSYILNRPVAWWGAAWGMIPVVMIGIGMLPTLWKLHRQWMPFTFLAVYFILTHRLSLDGTVFLFAFVMLPEPKTAPIRGAWRWGWGALVGLLVLAQNYLGITPPDPLLLALLIANLYGFIIRHAYHFGRRI